MRDPQTIIRTLFDHRYPEAVAHCDLEAYLALYTPDALWIRPGGQPRRGLAAIAEGFREMLADHTIRPTFVAQEIECHGSTATVLGRSDALVSTISSHEQEQSAFFALWIVREQQGDWLIHRQIWTPIR